jgi:hypothetical protein
VAYLEPSTSNQTVWDNDIFCPKIYRDHVGKKKHQNLFTVNRNDILIESMVNLLKSEFFVSVDPHFFVNHQRWFVTFFPITFWDYLIGIFEEKRASKTSPGGFLK